MYTYRFVFYEPGKNFYGKEEIQRLFNELAKAGFRLETPPHDPHFDKDGKYLTTDRETDISLRLKKSNRSLTFFLYPAEEDFHGEIASLYLPAEQFEEDPTKNAALMLEAANSILLGLQPLFAWGDHELEINKLEPFLRFDRIEALAWVNFFRKGLVDFLEGLEEVLLDPESEKNNYSKEWNFASVKISEDPTKPCDMPLACEARYPQALIRSFEIPSLKGKER